MLVNAMQAFTIAKREHKENQKAQYTDKTGNTGAKDFFRASELGSGDRKIIYSFFGHQLPKKGKSAQNLTQLENGDYVHERYQTAWEEMGVLISMEERLSSKDDEYLSRFSWEWNGHYDGLLDVNIMRAHALGYAKLESSLNEETGKYELDVDIDPVYGQSIGLFDENGEFSDDYEPLPLVADIKTMNPWGFKTIKEKADLSNIKGYLDQIMFYMYMHNTPYGSIYIESKDNNDVVEVQVLWTDIHDTEEDPYTYEWDTDVHGEKSKEIVRAKVSNAMFFGSEEQEGAVQRIDRLWTIVEEARKAEEEGDLARIAEIFPERCADTPESFPCSWGHKNGNPQYCEYFDHCWNKQHHGKATKPQEECPPEAIWEFDGEGDDVIQIDSRKVPKGVDYDGFITLVEMGALDYTKFLVDSATALSPSEEKTMELEQQAESALDADNLFDANGELKLYVTPGEAPTEAVEYMNEGKKTIDCLNCGKQISYQKLANGGTKKCPYCKHTNRVKRD